MKRVRINLYKKRGPLDFVGWMLGVQQRSAITHANIQIDDVCWTTGASFHLFKGWIFGHVAAEKYNRGRQYYSCEFVSPLSDSDIEEILLTCRELEGQRYGMGKVLRLAAVGNVKDDFICQLGKLDTETKDPFCSESVVYICWRLGRRVCEFLCRREPSVCTPHDLYLEALTGKILRIVEAVGFEL